MAYVCGASISTIPLFPSVVGSNTLHCPASYGFPPSVSTSSLQLKKPAFSLIRTKRLQYQKLARSPVRCAGQSSFLRTVLAVWNAGKSSVDFGMKLVPNAVPRPIARISVTVVALSIAVMGLSYFAFLSLNKDQSAKGSRGETSSTSVDVSIEEARKIMEKYK